MGRTFQLVSVFPRLSALENLLVFLQQHQEESAASAGCVRAPRRAAAGGGGGRARAPPPRLGRARRPGRGAGGQPLLRPAQAPRLRGRRSCPTPSCSCSTSRPPPSIPTMIEQMKEQIRALHRAGQDGAAGRAQHGRGDGHLPARGRARPRPEDRGGAAGGDPPRSAGHRGVLWLADAGRGEALLELEDVHAGLRRDRGAARRLGRRCGAGEIVSIIGANGAGKSTLLRTVFGMVTPTARRHPAGRRGHRRAGSRGCAAPRLLLRAAGTLQLPGDERGGEPRDGRLHALGRPRARATSRRCWTRFPMLGDKRRARAGTLSGGQQQILEMAIALLLHPRSSGRRAVARARPPDGGDRLLDDRRRQPARAPRC